MSERDQEYVQDGKRSEEICDELAHHQGKIQAALGLVCGRRVCMGRSINDNIPAD